MIATLFNIVLFVAQNFEDTYREVVANRAEQFLGLHYPEILLILLFSLTVLAICGIILVIILIIYHVKRIRALHLYIKSSNM